MNIFTNGFRPTTAGQAAPRRLNLRFSSSTASSKVRPISENETQSRKDVSQAESKTSGSESFHIDQANKTVKTATGSLPLSPMMDPSFHQIRGQYTAEPKKKRPRVGERPELDLYLERNIYAQILATPARACGATFTVLPSFFHLKFKVIKDSDPEVKYHWFVPTEVALKSDGLSQQEHIPGPGIHALCHQGLLRAFYSKRGDRYKSGWKMIMNRSTALRRVTPGTTKISKWREDMDSYILDLLRGHITQALVRFAGMVETADRKYLIRCDRWQDVKQHLPRGCLLYLGPDRVTGEKGDSQPPEDAELSGPKVKPPPARLSTLDLADVERGDKKIAIHDLRILLGEDNVARLRKRKALFRDGELFLLGGRRTNKLQMQLWRLQGYMVDEEQTPKVGSGDLGSYS